MHEKRFRARKTTATSELGSASTPATQCVVHSIQLGQLLLARVQHVCQRYGLTLSTANALAIIDGAEQPLPPNVIRDRLLITGGAVTQVLDALEQRGLVRRIAHPQDRRSVLVEITAEGRRLRQESEPYLNQCDEVWMAGLSGDEQNQLAFLLRKAQTYLQAHEERE